ncbi:DNA polymerase III subunit beta [Candidatus Peribacteria bacterium RIFCSPHIGHO2_02_FULL_52_16]|nr:MAG: DNA polymerase III subunit beta [Candidatus Peribacteria bacterium RIFCSPHIGHO2_01_FULL_51_35]OGJ61963.1 MAG: DNA polymerase III subunit beta [Candidatus Peribacteria bacterium RIFCSPHIGHO2_02_FULL_52_16]
MKFSCNTGDLLQALHLVSRAIGTQQALPILGNILMKVEGKRCTVSATDLELSIITSFEANIENEGSITIPAKAIVNFAQYNNDAEVLLETSEGTQLKCTSKHAKTLIAGEAASEYPTISTVEKQTSFTLEADPLLHALHMVTFASTKTTLRPVLSGVYFRTEKGKLILVATDSYRLSEYKMPLQGGASDLSCIIPTKILEELKIILGARKGEKKSEGKEDKKEKDVIKESALKVEATMSKQQIEFQIGSTRLLSRLIDGKFPDYEQIIPKDTKTKVLFSTHELLVATRRMHYFAKEMNNNLTFHIAKGEARVMTPQTQAGRDEASLVVEKSGDDNKIALSSSYLLDFLGHTGDSNVEMRIVDSVHPAVFVAPQTPHCLHLIMPLRMQEE